MTATLYLIAHKVRGEPAFDIAVKMPMADGDWWIIPTSGHRAYPWWTMELFHLCIGPMTVDELCPPDTMPRDLPDHYPTHDLAPREAGVRRYNEALNVPRLEDI